MLEVIKLFKQIQNTSSLNDKKAIISANKDNELFKKCLVFLLDGNVVTGISTAKIKKEIWLDSYVLRLDTFEEVMDYLAENNTGTDLNVLTVQMFIRANAEYRDFYEEMVTK